MWKVWLWIVIPLAILAILTGPAWSNHEMIPFIKEGMVMMPATCPVSKEGLIDKTSSVKVPCTAFIDPDNDVVFWVVIETPTGTAVLCLEITTKTGAQRIVWRYGEEGV